MKENVIRFPRVIRDPLYGDIVMTEHEWRIINCPEFQRLRWFRQLGTANLVYPGAEHTRFGHAIGTVCVADTILKRIEDRTGAKFEPEERLGVRLYALVHDLTHIAFGHTIEDELNIFTIHDRNEARINRLLLSGRSAVAGLLRLTEYGQEILALFGNKSTARKRLWICDLVDSPFGADVIDYINRDAYHCGLDHKVDSAILRRISLSPTGELDGKQRKVTAGLFGRKGYRIDAEFALDSLLYERLGLYMKIYMHPAKVSSGAMVGKALWGAISNKKDSLDEKQIEWMGDQELLLRLRESSKAWVRELVGRVMGRQLYKPVFMARVLDAGEYDESKYKRRQMRLQEKGLFDPALRAKLEVRIARRCGLKPHEVIIYCPPKAPGLRRVRYYVSREPGSQEARDELYSSHRRVAAAHIALWLVYVFIPSEMDQNVRNNVATAAEEIIELPNEVSLDQRQFMMTF